MYNLAAIFLHERENPLPQSLDKVVLTAKTLESAKDSVAAKCKTMQKLMMFANYTISRSNSFIGTSNWHYVNSNCTCQFKFVRCQFEFILCHFKWALCQIRFIDHLPFQIIHSHFKLVNCQFKFIHSHFKSVMSHFKFTVSCYYPLHVDSCDCTPPSLVSIFRCALSY